VSSASLGGPAYDRLPRPDWAGTTTITSAVADLDARTWAEAIFDVDGLGPVGRVVMAARDVVARTLGIPPGDPSMLAVSAVEDGEAVIDTDDRHLRFVATVATDPARALVHVVTLVSFKGWRGRLYFVPVRFLHDPITRRMMEKASRRLQRR
jgi:hypothetical protein